MMLTMMLTMMLAMMLAMRKKTSRRWYDRVRSSQRQQPTPWGEFLQLVRPI